MAARSVAKRPVVAKSNIELHDMVCAELGVPVGSVPSYSVDPLGVVVDMPGLVRLGGVGVYDVGVLGGVMLGGVVDVVDDA